MGADSPGGQSSSDRSARCEGGSYPDTASAAARAADRAETPPGPTPRRGNATVPRSPSTSARVAARPVVDGDSTGSTCACGGRPGAWTTPKPQATSNADLYARTRSGYHPRGGRARNGDVHDGAVPRGGDAGRGMVHLGG